MDSSCIVFADVDGTIFTAGWQIIKAPFYNVQTSRILEQHHIPLILVTGRPTWTNKSEWLMKLIGIPPADAIIFGAGTIIYTRLSNGKLEKDTEWENRIFWDKKPVEKFVVSYFKKKNIPFELIEKDQHVVRVTLACFPVSEMEKVKQVILTEFSDDIQALFTEKLLKENTRDIFTGDLLIHPKTAGKDNAVRYLLQKYYDVIARSKATKQSHKDKETIGSETNGIASPFSPFKARNDVFRIHALIFGDATIDIPMLSIRMNSNKFLLSQYAVHPTPLAKKFLLEKQKENKNIVITDKEGPQFILETVKKYFTKNKDASPAQNSTSRLLIKPFEPLLDKIIDQKLTPNEISFLGLDEVKKGIDLLYEKNNFLFKIKGLYLYALGNFTDVLDGIRARNKLRHCEEQSQVPDGTWQSDEAIPEGSKNNEIASPFSSFKVRNDVHKIPGQLVDVFCDRTKEFYQAFMRAKKRSGNEVVLTCMTAMSCILPSIARAQSEISGIIVKEQDEKGGSMFERTKRLFLSLLYDVFGNSRKSLEIDREIYERNIATFENRLSMRKLEVGGASVDMEVGNGRLEGNALERFLLLIQLLQKENEIIEEFLKQNPKILQEYKNKSGKLIQNYLEIDVKRLRKKYRFKNYRLSLKHSI